MFHATATAADYFILVNGTADQVWATAEKPARRGVHIYFPHNIQLKQLHN